MAWHFCQNAAGACVLGLVTIRIGFLRCCMIDNRRLQSVGVSGVNVISQAYERSHAFESCLDNKSICVWNGGVADRT